MAISLVTPFSSWTQRLGANIMVNFNGSSLVEQANTLLTESSVNWKLREDPELDNRIEETSVS